MKIRFILYLCFISALILSTTIAAQENKTPAAATSQDPAESNGTESRDMNDEIRQSQKAAKVFSQIMNVPDNRIPQSIFDSAECVAVFPDVIKAGFVVGGRGGRGVVSCRVGNSWGAPVYLSMAGGSFGLQIGAQSTDFVLLFMNRDGINSLLKSKLTLGGDASAAAGPVGRQTGAETDLKFNAKVLSYSRSKGVFAGLELKGVVITVKGSDMRDVYGDVFSSREILLENKGAVPPGVRAFPNTLARYSTRNGERATR